MVKLARFATVALLVALVACPLARADGTAVNRRIVLAGNTSPTPGEHRLALVIGNSHYGGLYTLKNPENDARAMAETLQSVGFTTTLLFDATRESLRDTVHQFKSDIVKSGPHTVALLYYSGHGMQIVGKNYLVPIGFNVPANAEDMDDYAYPAQKALDEMQDAQAMVNVVILDACRDSPYSAKKSWAGKGLARVETTGIYVAYATAEGATASDNPNGTNGLYTQELLANMKTPGLNIHQVFQKTRKAVFEKSNHEQYPYVYDGLLSDDFYFDGLPAPGPVAPPKPRPDLTQPFVVSLAGDTPFSSIQDAINASPVGGKIVVRSGVYRESLTVTRPVTIAIDPAAVPGSAVVEGQDQPAMTMEAPTASVVGMAFRIGRRNAARSLTAVEIDGGKALFEGCDFGEAAEECLDIRGAGVAPTLRHCAIHDGAKYGVLVKDKAAPTLEASDIVSGSYAGITVSNAQVNVVGGKIWGSGPMSVELSGTTTGIAGKDGASINVASCHIGQNLTTGISLVSVVPTDVEGQPIRSTGAKAPSILSTFSDCEIDHCSRFGVLTINARTKFDRCHVHDCDRAFQCTGASAIDVNSCIWNSCFGYGLVVESGSVANLNTCKCYDVTNEAIFIGGHGSSATATVLNCDVSRSGNRCAVQANKSVLTVKDTNIHDVPAIGIIFDNSATGIVMRVAFLKTGSTALYGNSNSTLAINDCKIAGTGHHGFDFGSCNVTIKECQVTAASDCGIVDGGSGVVTLTSSSFTGCREGIHSDSGGHIDTSDCTVTNASEWGIDATGGTVTTTNCTFSGNKLGDVKPSAPLAEAPK